MSATDRVRVGVVGVGAIGRHHARIYAEHPDAELVGVHDIDADRARRIAEKHGTRAFESLEELLAQIEGASVAVPTLEHRHVGLACLDAGVDLLAEKPVAAELADADRLIERASERGRVLQVGHVERYNPAVEAVSRRVVDPRFIEVHRLGSFVPRSLEVDVVLDLMIHDIDVVHSLVDGEVEEVRAVGVPVLSEEVDIANARLQMSTGCIVNMTASRVSMSRVRKVRIFQPAAYFSVDYSDQAVAAFRLEREDQRSAIQAEPVEVTRGEPLVAELSDFLRCVKTRETPRVDGAAGRRALETALRIREAIQGQPFGA
jgi:predicted dehydrogenase